ncbi:SCP2 sterol-binding domain-containing protein [Marinobacterium jannaschii]|uniref:SCP2 sterol-binding domain-containing protein n=1 Tax=Marinobacterium jannaschii TaxID=64970 RepID=UPI00048061B7|nr:SCP2 sterol-binding domain-containing protein [Marinobacterium jannaschii]
MSTPVTVNKVIEKLPGRFIAENAADMTAIFQFLIEDDSSFYIDIADSSCAVVSGEHIDPNITLITDAATVIDVVNGDIDGMSAFLKGRLRAEGNVLLATKLGKLFSKEKRD